MKHWLLAVLFTGLALLPFIRHKHLPYPTLEPSDTDIRYDIDEFLADLEP